MKEKRQTKEKIIESAYKEFAEKGFSGARMQKIAEKAGVNKAMLHYYFRSKEMLYETVIAYFHSLFEKEIQEKSVETRDLKTFLQDVMDVYYKIFFTYPDVKKIFLQELANGMKTMKKILKKNNSDNIEKILERFFLLTKIKELQAQGEIRNDMAPEQVMFTVIGLIESSFLQAHIAAMILDYGERETSDFLRKRRESVLKILEKGLKAT